MNPAQIKPKRQLFPIVAADVALFTINAASLRVLLIERGNEPQAGAFALPGAILDPAKDRSLEDTARRALEVRMTGVAELYLEQVAAFSGADRDPRGYSVSVAYYALLPLDQTLAVHAVAGGKAKAVIWPDVTKLDRSVAFDHREIIKQAVARLRDKVERFSLPLHLLPKTFTLGQLQAVCEAVLGHHLDKSSFRRRLKSEKGLVTVQGKFVRGPNRPAQLYRAAAGFRF